MKKKIIPLIFFSILVYSCSRTLYMPVSTDPAKQQKLISGRSLYIDNCSSCHNLHFPNEFDASGWKSKLDGMQVKANINDSEKQLIFEYLISQL